MSANFSVMSQKFAYKTVVCKLLTHDTSDVWQQNTSKLNFVNSVMLLNKATQPLHIKFLATLTKLCYVAVNDIFDERQDKKHYKSNREG